METFELYKDISERTGGSIYLGVVGPVRTGKSTFIKKFMDLCILPNITDPNTKERAVDELPQSAAGRTVMTTQPKFVPNEAIQMSLGDGTDFSIRLIDCVGYLIPGAEGDTENGAPRMVHTPWSEEPMPFQKAAEVGTNKVIRDHSTLGLVVTTDGSISDIPRENYVTAEAQVVQELKGLGKPFVMLLNSAKPYAPETETLRESLETQYQAPVLSMNCAQLKQEDAQHILETLLYEFPLREVLLSFPAWLESLPYNHWLKQALIPALKALLPNLTKLGKLKEVLATLEDSPYIRKLFLNQIKPGEGSASGEISLPEELFYKVLSETTGTPVENDAQLISALRELTTAKKDYDKLAAALGDVRRKGYGIVTPSLGELTLEEPAVFRQGNRYGIRLKARGETIHLIKADVESDVSPIVGTEEQSKDFIAAITQDWQNDPAKVWDLNLFGRSLSSLIDDGIQNKVYRMPEDAQQKLQETLQKIMNQGSGTLICIVF